MNLHDQLTDDQRRASAESRARLEAEVARLQARPTFDHRPRLTAPVPDTAVSVADTMPEVAAMLDRAHAHWKEFCASLLPQFEGAPATIICDHHPEQIRPKLFDETCRLTRQDGAYRTVYTPCPACAADAVTARRRAFWRKRGVPERVADATLANFVTGSDLQAGALADVQAWLRRRGTFLLLRGTPGTGKGHLASACLKAHGHGLWITQADMLSDLRASYTLHTTPAVLERWREAEMLVLDEFGLSPGGNDEEAMLYQVLAERYDKRRPTIITTNLDRPHFAEAIGDRLYDRIGEDFAAVTCAWDSFRQKKG